jgi:hypothetical protein
LNNTETFSELDIVASNIFTIALVRPFESAYANKTISSQIKYQMWVGSLKDLEIIAQEYLKNEGN